MKKISFCDNWKFTSSDGREETVSLPHDAMIGSKRSSSSKTNGAQAYFSGGRYRYEKTFDLPKKWERKNIKLHFEGVYKNAKVFVNGREAGGAVYGYIPFWVDCGVLPAGENTIAVECENMDQPDSRWYAGAGIYRPVWAYVGKGITEEDIKITTLSTNPAKIEVRVDTDEPVKIEIADSNGKTAVKAEGAVNEIEIPNAKLWDDERPNLYVCRVKLCNKRGVYDTTEVKFGIRTITWSSNGLFVNGKNTLLRGGCIHHDSGILGSACYDESEYRRAKKLKEAGYNAIRSAHNPVSRAMLEACDELGLYIMDETWDMWYKHKNKYDYALYWEKNHKYDIEAMVKRDYNHPSVILYSIGNEVSEPAEPKGVETAKKLVAAFHEFDSTRPVTAGLNLIILFTSSMGFGIYDENKPAPTDIKLNGLDSTTFNMMSYFAGSSMNDMCVFSMVDKLITPVCNALDICGYNYGSGRYKIDGKKHPQRLIVGSETLPQDIAKNWKTVEKYPNLCGDFMWTAWDYLGEAGVGAWSYRKEDRSFSKPFPWLIADVGTFDILGNPNGELFQTEAVWGKLDKPKIAVKPVNHQGVKPIKGTWRGTNSIESWSWNGCEGNDAEVEVYFDCFAVELFVNGISKGKKKMKDCKAVYKIKYHSGNIKAKAYDAMGFMFAESTLLSAEKTSPKIESEKEEIHEGEVVYMPVKIEDRNGTVESNSDETLTVSVEGGKLLAFGSAAQYSEESYLSGTFTTYYGRALAIVKAGNAGKLKVCVESKTGEKDFIELEIK